jgi:hypothetical protein
MRPPWPVLLICSSLSASGSGCSVAFSEGPPPRQQRLPDFDCSSGYGLPAFDTALSVLGFAFLAIGGGGSASESLNTTRGLVSVASATAFAISAVIGYQNVYACREALEEAEPAPELPHHRRAQPPPRVLAPAPQPPAPPVPQASDPTDGP